ncbi:MAG TPA: polysaccharide biosynthesis/export family protein [Rhizomicrobium sp.]|jgi:protein involved in polysaccharide export with SLBB domain
MRPICLFFSAALALGGCSLMDGGAPQPQAVDVLEPGDTLKITVAGEEELSGVFAVNPDRTVHLELVGAVPAGGLSVTAFEGSLRQRLAAGYLKDPQVLVARVSTDAMVAAPLAPPVLRQSQN